MLIPKPPTRFIERWKINADETLRSDPEFQSLKGEAQAALRLATQESLTAHRYEFTEDGLLLFGREGQLLPIAKYEVDHAVTTASPVLTLLGLRDGSAKRLNFAIHRCEGWFLREAHTTVLSRD